MAQRSVCHFYILLCLCLRWPSGCPHVEEFKPESWIHMAGYKRWGLQEDLMPSNHKIQADCRGTDMAESLIDGITYGKGSSMIK